jgi:hypothetical protein
LGFFFFNFKISFLSKYNIINKTINNLNDLKANLIYNEVKIDFLNITINFISTQIFQNNDTESHILEILKFAKNLNSKGNSTILFGNFDINKNQYLKILEFFYDSFVICNPNLIGNTYPVGNPSKRKDFIFFSKLNNKFNVSFSNVLYNFDGSDHYPLISNLNFKIN